MAGSPTSWVWSTIITITSSNACHDSRGTKRGLRLDTLEERNTHNTSSPPSAQKCLYSSTVATDMGVSERTIRMADGEKTPTECNKTCWRGSPTLAHRGGASIFTTFIPVQLQIAMYIAPASAENAFMPRMLHIFLEKFKILKSLEQNQPRVSSSMGS